ncbi:hypothetical protein BRW65_10525 [Mycobacterium paraffinicum]|uniref:Uncharacterized protein n=1 Tax=Mycobacterium paraffinicum TaxID=53378 RepID=A0A1Q4HX55_9MYCO|nr:hypothetical protein [Mycobacterium paraffinicum]OJZ74249.1 hypothetical protein BRW65_10525 [Mycobacterium paraffinicum]
MYDHHEQWGAARQEGRTLHYDTVITNGRWFDGTGAPSARRNIGVRDGRVATVSPEPLDTTGAEFLRAGQEAASLTPVA